jgi:hypothetical protein
MQSVVAIDRDGERRQPSERLQEKIRNCVSVFRSLNETVNEVIEIGKSEGFTPKEIGHFIRQEMIKSGLSRMTITRYLPAELKAKPRGFQVSNKMLQTPPPSTAVTIQTQTKKEEFSNKMLQTQMRSLPDDDIEQFSMANRYLYKHQFLGKVIDHLAQVYNEKTGQQIKVIFRKMIDDDSSTSKDKDKKYQPTPDEVKQRENKVLSLVKKDIVKISEIVEKSGVSESATRRYLLKAGYKITAGTVSR